jgi:hypothetical protein
MKMKIERIFPMRNRFSWLLEGVYGRIFDETKKKAPKWASILRSSITC